MSAMAIYQQLSFRLGRLGNKIVQHIASES
jgi:hypothetical protein